MLTYQLHLQIAFNTCMTHQAVSKIGKTQSELSILALAKIRTQPGCDRIQSIEITLDDDGEWSINVLDRGDSDPSDVRVGALAAERYLRTRYNYDPLA